MCGTLIKAACCGSVIEPHDFQVRKTGAILLHINDDDDVKWEGAIVSSGVPL